MINHLTLEKRKRFFDDFFDYKSTAPGYRAEDTGPLLMVTSRLAAEGVSTLRKTHSLERVKIPSKTEVAQALQSHGYEFCEYRGDLCLWKFGPKCVNGPDFYMEFDHSAKRFDLVGTPEDLKVTDILLGELFPDTHIKTQLAYQVDQHGLHTTPRMIKKDEKALDSFYPFLSKSMHKYFSEFMASKSSVLLLIGPPGTGKSSFLRELIRFAQVKTLLAYNKEVIESPHLYQGVRTGDYELLALEDADNFVRARKDENPFMATLLNDTQGVANASNMKIVISTNLTSLNHVDHALVRTGRCFGVLHFRDLVAKEARKVWRDMGMKGRKFEGEHMSLSDILNPPQVYEDSKARTPNPVGFIPQETRPRTTPPKKLVDQPAPPSAPSLVEPMPVAA